MLNFETVKYFNAEKHEEERYMKALQEYKLENIAVTRSMVVLNMSQVSVVIISLFINLFLALILVDKKVLTLGDFILILTYILQVYAPLNFLGTYWRWIR